MLYNSVPTDAHELDDLHNTISNDVVPTNNVFITPAIIKQCLNCIHACTLYAFMYVSDIYL